jgi:hypothetical protein
MTQTKPKLDWPTAWEWEQMSQSARLQIACQLARQATDRRDPTYPRGALTMAQQQALQLVKIAMLDER